MDRIPTFSDGFTAASRDEMKRLAHDTRITPLHFRLLFLALGRCNSIGHTEFKPGELSVELGTLDKRTGEIVPLTKQTMQKVLRSARYLGLIGPESGSRCVVLVPTMFAYGVSSSGSTCRHHGIGVSKRRRRRRPQPSLRVVS